MSQTRFFGHKWDAPRVDDAVQIDTPVGELCIHCEEPIEVGDRGLMTLVAKMGEDACEIRPAHLECDLRCTLSHVYRQCLCFVQHRTLRDEARATLAAINAERAERGIGPL